jgi:hypothetical protein
MGSASVWVHDMCLRHSEVCHALSSALKSSGLGTRRDTTGGCHAGAIGVEPPSSVTDCDRPLYVSVSRINLGRPDGQSHASQRQPSP